MVCPPAKSPRLERPDGGHGASAPLPTLRTAPRGLMIQRNSARELAGGLAQVGVDAGLPSAACLAIGGEDVVIEAELDRLLWIFQRRPATPDYSVAVANFGTGQHLFGQLGRLVVFGLGDAVGINFGQIAFDRSLFHGHCIFSSTSVRSSRLLNV